MLNVAAAAQRERAPGEETYLKADAPKQREYERIMADEEAQSAAKVYTVSALLDVKPHLRRPPAA